MAEPPVYFAFTGGRQIGPLQFAEMADLAARGVLSPDDLAWKSGTPEWVPAQQLVAFPRRRPPSGIREALKSPSEARLSEEFTDLSRPDAPARARPAQSFSPFEAPAAAPAALAPSAGPAAPADTALDPGTWKRVSLSTRSDDPGLSVVDSAAAGDAEEEAAAPRAAPVSRLLPALPEALAPARLGDAAILGSAVTWALVFFGLGPLLLAALAEDPILRVRLVHFGCGALWLMFFYAAFRPDTDVTRSTLGLFFGAALFGALYVGALVAAPPLATLAPFAAPGRNVAWRLLASLSGAALVQELGKAAVVVLVVRVLGAGSDGRHGLYAGLIVGAGFGLTLSVVQVPVLPAAEEAALKGAESPSTALYAWFLGTWVAAAMRPFLQAIWSALAAFFLVPAVTRGRRTGPAFFGLGAAVVLHALYDAFVSGVTALLAVLVAAASLGAFLLARRSAEEEPALSPPGS
jgi:hypothetical protein